MVTSTFYDLTWQKPVISIDANNNPGQLVEYDGFGRPINVFKIDKTKSRGYLGADTILQNKVYHLMNETATFPDPTKWYTITSNAAAKVLDADNTGDGIQNASKAQVYALATSPQQSNQQWKFQVASDGKYRIICKEKPQYCLAVDVNTGTVNGQDQGDVKMAMIGYGDNFKWDVQPVDGSPNIYRIVSPYASATADIPLVLDADNSGGIVDGSVVQVWESTGASNQQWIITEVP